MPSSQQLQDGKDLKLGILFLIDNLPQRSSKESWRVFSTRAIKEHLERHSYYQFQGGKRALVTVDVFRRYVARLYKGNPEKALHPLKPKEDPTDGFFRHGQDAGSSMFSEKYLSSHKYNKDTFCESQLNKHQSENLTSARVRPNGIGGVHGKFKDNDEDQSDERDHQSKQTSSQSEAGTAVPPPAQPTLSSPSSLLSTPLQKSTDRRTGLVLKLGTGAITGKHSPHAQEGSLSPTGGGQLCTNDNTTACCDTPYASDEADSTSSEDRLDRSDVLTVGAKRKYDAVEPLNVIHWDDEELVHALEPAKKRRRAGKETAQTSLIEKAQSSTVKRPSKAQKTNSRTGPRRPNTVLPTASRTESSKIRQKKTGQPQLAELNVDEQGRDLSELSRGLKEAVNVIVECIGNVRDEQSPLNTNSPGPLKSLYMRCWGSHWKEVRFRLRNKSVFTTPRVLMSLLAAFLHDKVLIQEASRGDIRKSCLELRGTSSKAMLELIDGEFWDS